ncbi:unnamed protein product [Euphydryas editha]|uniref:Uncharacterized protein n=1 Tax=Euphydryas editha TaxID=104508 RepID=A0AAU9TSD4_EUPED|nr:unnamed protein product [Euphydryas editha]
MTKRVEGLSMELDGQTLRAKESAKLLTEMFYTEDRCADDSELHHAVSIRVVAEVSLTGVGGDTSTAYHELRLASLSFNLKKTSGVDEITADIFLRAIQSSPELFLALFNKCLEIHHFR